MAQDQWDDEHHERRAIIAIGDDERNERRAIIAIVEVLAWIPMNTYSRHLSYIFLLRVQPCLTSHIINSYLLVIEQRHTCALPSRTSEQDCLPST